MQMRKLARKLLIVSARPVNSTLLGPRKFAYLVQDKILPFGIGPPIPRIGASGNPDALPGPVSVRYANEDIPWSPTRKYNKGPSVALELTAD